MNYIGGLLGESERKNRSAEAHGEACLKWHLTLSGVDLPSITSFLSQKRPGQNLRKSDSEALLRSPLASPLGRSADRIFHLNPMPRVIHITLEIPNRSGILWLAISGTMPCPHDNL